MPNVVSPDEIPKLLTRGATVFVQGATGEPTVLVEALRRFPEHSRDTHYIFCGLPGINRSDFAGLHETASATSFFVYDTNDAGSEAGRVRFVPQHYRGTYDYLSRQTPDFALIQTAAPDSGGRCSLGTSVDFVPAVLDSDVTLIAEVNRQMPAPPGSPTIPFDGIDYVVSTDRPLIEVPAGEASRTAKQVAANVVGLIGDGDCLQFGIGKIPASVLSLLGDRRDLGIHGGMLTDEVVDLHGAGAVTGARKAIEAGRMVCGVLVGTNKLYEWASKRDDILYRPVNYTHDVRVIAQLDNFVSINSVLSVDLAGQANAEMLNGRQIGGTGGLLDFVRGARLSRGGRSILALTATAGRGRHSRIVGKLGEASMVSCPRADIDYVVTEYGAARLRDKSTDERAEALIGLAAPQFRQALTTEWEESQRSTRR